MRGTVHLFNHIEWVATTGADMVTVTLPIMLVWIKRHFPDFKVVVSSWARVANVKRAKYWEDLGADEIILAEYATRDFAALRSMRRALRCKLEVIANPSCLYYVLSRYEPYQHDVPLGTGRPHQRWFCSGPLSGLLPANETGETR